MLLFKSTEILKNFAFNQVLTDNYNDNFGRHAAGHFDKFYYNTPWSSFISNAN